MSVLTLLPSLVFTAVVQSTKQNHARNKRLETSTGNQILFVGNKGTDTPKSNLAGQDDKVKHSCSTYGSHGNTANGHNTIRHLHTKKARQPHSRGNENTKQRSCDPKQEQMKIQRFNRLTGKKVTPSEKNITYNSGTWLLVPDQVVSGSGFYQRRGLEKLIITPKCERIAPESPRLLFAFARPRRLTHSRPYKSPDDVFVSPATNKLCN